MGKNVLERMKENDSEHKIAMFKVKQQQDYSFKKKYARIRAWEFYNHPEIDGMAYVAVVGLDSITLHVFLRSIGIDVPAISVSSLEDKSIQRVHKALGVIALPPAKREDGRYWNKTGETGEYGGLRTGTRMQLARKWLDPFGGLGTVALEAMKAGRRGYTIELNDGYFRDAVGYLKEYEEENRNISLFDLIE